jgi:hypothetical protein
LFSLSGFPERQHTSRDWLQCAKGKAEQRRGIKRLQCAKGKAAKKRSIKGCRARRARLQRNAILKAAEREGQDCKETQY